MIMKAKLIAKDCPIIERNICDVSRACDISLNKENNTKSNKVRIIDK